MSIGPSERMRVRGPQGRRLDVEIAGPEDGRILFLHGGTPGAATMFAATIEAGADRGIRHVSYARPGYGGSDRHAGRTVGDCAQDVAAIADALGVERMLTIGVSGGGPHVLACAALLPERVIAAASVAGVAPMDADGLDWMAGMGQENVAEFEAMVAGELPLREWLETEGSAMAQASGREIRAALGDLLSDVDRAALTGELAEYLAANMHEALSPGIWGWFDDDVALLQNWGFDLAQIERPVTIWQGAQDRFVPFAHGEWLAEHVAGARAELRGDHGHLSLIAGGYGEVLDGLLASAGA